MLSQSLLSLLALSSLSVAAPLVGVVPAADLDALTSGDLSTVTDVVEGTLSSVKIPRADVLSEAESTADSVPGVAGPLSTVEETASTIPLAAASIQNLAGDAVVPATKVVNGALNNVKRLNPLAEGEGTLATIPGASEVGSELSGVRGTVADFPAVGDVESAVAPAVAPVLGAATGAVAGVNIKRRVMASAEDLASDPTAILGKVEPAAAPVAGSVLTTVEGVAAPVVGQVESAAGPLVGSALNTVGGTAAGVNIKRNVISQVKGVASAPSKIVGSAIVPVEDNLSENKIEDNAVGAVIANGNKITDNTVGVIASGNKVKDNVNGNDVLSSNSAAVGSGSFNDNTLVNIEGGKGGEEGYGSGSGYGDGSASGYQPSSGY